MLAQAQCHMNAAMLFLRPALLWKEYICFCENLAGSIPRQLRYFSTRVIGAGFGGRGQEGGAETPSADLASILDLAGFIRPGFAPAVPDPHCLPAFAPASQNPRSYGAQ